MQVKPKKIVPQLESKSANEISRNNPISPSLESPGCEVVFHFLSKNYFKELLTLKLVSTSTCAMANLFLPMQKFDFYELAPLLVNRSMETYSQEESRLTYALQRCLSVMIDNEGELNQIVDLKDEPKLFNKIKGLDISRLDQKEQYLPTIREIFTTIVSLKLGISTPGITSWTVDNFVHLRKLEVGNLKIPMTMEHLPSLELFDCKSLVCPNAKFIFENHNRIEIIKLPNISCESFNLVNLPRLHTLDISEISSSTPVKLENLGLEEFMVPDIYNRFEMKSCQNLRVLSFNSIYKTPTIGFFPNLRQLDFSYVTGRESKEVFLKSFNHENFPSLKHLHYVPSEIKQEYLKILRLLKVYII